MKYYYCFFAKQLLQYFSPQFSWSCQMESGGSCLTIDEKMTTLSEKLQKNGSLKQTELEIPANTLPAGKYVFGLEVFNEKSKSKINSTVEVVTGDVPVVEILASNTEVDPSHAFTAIGT